MSSTSLHLAERSYNAFRSGAAYYARQAATALPEKPTQNPLPRPRAEQRYRRPSPPRAMTNSRAPDEIHRPSLGCSSLGHLISEISSTKPGMEGIRIEGQTISEDQRAFARNAVTWMMGLPVLIGTGIVGGSLYKSWHREKRAHV